MLPFARFIMQGRNQALGFVFFNLLISPVFWPGEIFAAAGLSLVCLRIGIRDGALLWLWALLPSAGLAVYLDSFMPLLLMTSAGLGSTVLRKSQSWQYTLLCLSACSLLASIGLDQFASVKLAPVVDAFNAFLKQLQEQLPNSELKGLLPQTVGTTFVAGLFGGLLSVAGFWSVALARSWQAQLYNPGGFQKEFHGLRLGKIASVAALLLTGLLFELGIQYLAWVWMVIFPLLVAGVALFHAYALHKRLAIYWYFVFYGVLVMWDPLKLILAGLAFADSFVDWRSRFVDRTKDQES